MGLELAMRDNRYYDQKAAGLATDFDLPPSFTASAGDDPQGLARDLAAVILDPERHPDLRRHLAVRARTQWQRRGATRPS